MNFNNFIKSVLKEKILTLVITFVSILSILLYIFLYLDGKDELGKEILKWVLFFGSIQIWFNLIKEIIKKNLGVDLIASVALFATFFFGQYLAGLIILLMLSGGEALESYAFFRARRDLSLLLSRAPNKAHLTDGKTITDVPIEEVQIGQKVMVKPGEVIPIDGIVEEGNTYVDESTLSGESNPGQKSEGSFVYSGTVNQNSTMTLLVTKLASESSYAHIVKLVQEAEQSRAPMIRLADRYSVYFTITTFIFAGGTWFLTHDIVRMLAVLVVATPCPLILATPIAIISGMSKITKHGIIVKNGGALEKLAEARSFVFDKTGTVTIGTPQIDRVFSYEGDEDKLVRIAGSLDQLSAHVLAEAMVNEAEKRKLKLSFPTDFKEEFGGGVEGNVDGVKYIFGKLSYVKKFIADLPGDIEKTLEEFKNEGKSVVFLAHEKSVMGYIVLDDKLRSDSHELFDELRKDGIQRIILLSGDKQSVADRIGIALNIKEVHSECLPEDKLRIIKEIPATDRPCVMVGDGINDAPALAQAEVGIALGSKGKTASSESADMVILGEGINRIHDVYHIAQKTINVAKQGIFIGIGLSVGAMILGSVGIISPLAGALIQEVIDLIVIINALRVSQIV
ncbi:MAG: heavy metal translocating P-type ATPase [Candidatus Paceibacterota bacterium]|jgi:heavy metal translocating P-type ATPase